MMCVFLPLCLITLAALLSDTEAILSEVCIPAQQYNALVPLRGCEGNTMIHVVQEVTGLATNTCTVAHSSCIIVRDSSELTVNCNGLQTCQESVRINASSCISSQLAAAVDFDCVEGSQNICSPINSVKDGPVYLHSPGFPNSISVSGDCSCTITGSQMVVELLDLFSTQVMDISADGIQVWPVPRQLPVQYNREMVGHGATVKMVDTVDVTYRTRNTTSKQNVWLKISGTGGLRVQCSGDASHLPGSPLPSTPPPSSSTTTTVTSLPVTTTSTNNPVDADSSTTTASSSRDSTTIDSVSGSTDASTATIAAVVLGVIVFILLAIIIIGGIYINRIKNGRNSTKREHEIEGEVIAQYEVPPRVYDDIQEPSRDPNNIYNGLYLNLDEPTAHDYSDIHEYYNTRHTPEIPTGYI